MFMTSFLKRWKVVVGWNECLCEKSRREISWNSQENICAWKTLAQVFPCEFCEICKSIFFAEHHWTTASDYSSINRSEGRINYHELF